ncbi:hypothetical protein AMS68_002247 [Peltaster fructicola]|uniref:Very-long-chain 3-oxoacyl-CoA reductase n=1 Tax=Peltaster fructicola TaxID=286661 RepID=A0A6H0XQH7_9PEZI|nr:hypothetical protein AMS68_002247 [Peltaster fructicola]
MQTDKLQLPQWLLYALAGIGASTTSYGLLQGLRTVLTYTRPSKLPRYLHYPSGSWALVTGSSDGIGRGFAEELLSRGFNVVLHGRNEQKLQRLMRELSDKHKQRQLQILVADATDTGVDFTGIKRQMQGLPGKLTVLVNNVGGIHSGKTYNTLDGYTSQQLVDCINANATFTTLITSALLPLLRDNGPSLILNCGSIVTTVHPPYIATYAGTKGYIHTWASSLRLEIKAQGYDSQVEVLTAAIGNTASSGNTYEEDGSTLTARECAKACLDRVGCGHDVVIPHPKFLLFTLPFFILPTNLMKNVMIPIMKKRFDESEKAAERKES